ncbi:photosynthetic protein synthase I [Nitrosomonas sp. PY1]|uniref:SCO family protein n=1 Tax=Nitrosomonas sp. PY1 TaxID=1803906 RepID=UPI001FC832B5|nr:SCO family protein [Nitrosomonas sp. PY1]GKS69437.1 photosynthetic protein synthase I [Nitrosomonas sp. PY1]
MFAKLSVILIALIATTLWAQPSENSKKPEKINTAHRTHLVLPNIIVLDDQNQEHRFLDLLQSQVALVNFVFTSCVTICPVLSATMQAIEKQLQDQLGKGVILVSISVDPAKDTPDKLRAYAKKFNAGQYWYWLTGRPSEVNQLLKAFGMPTGRPEDHPPIILVGNVDTDNWLRWIGIPLPENIIEAINILAKDNLGK